MLKRLIGRSAILSGPSVSGADAEGLIRRVLLFDQYILSSVRLKEFPYLVSAFGYEGLRDLLDTNLVEIKCECLVVGQAGQTSLLTNPVLPLYSYKFVRVDTHDRREYISRCLRDLPYPAGLRSRDFKRLKKRIVDNIRPLPASVRPNLIPATVAELHNMKIVRAALDMAIFRELAAYQIPYNFSIHQEDEYTFRVTTDLATVARIDHMRAHKIIESALMAVGGLSQGLLEMEAYGAISGFRDEDAPLYQHKLAQVRDALTSESREQNFSRVVEIALPGLSFNGPVLDVDVLLEIKESLEFRDFRSWLDSVGCLTDDQIREVVAGLRAKLGLWVSSPAGEIVRFIVASLGLIKNPAVALGVAGFEHFVLNRLFPRTSIAAFVNELYPSLFKADAIGAPPTSGEIQR